MNVTEIEWEGKPSFLASIFDISTIKAAGELAKKANEELLRLNTMKTQFISIASHELRTPLTSIKNAVDILESKKAGDLTAHQDRFLIMAARNIDRMSAMINDLLDLTKLESRKMDLHWAEVNVGTIFQQLLETFKPQADGKSLALEADFPEEPTRDLWGSIERLEQVFFNLISNALKFTPQVACA